MINIEELTKIFSKITSENNGQFVRIIFPIKSTKNGTFGDYTCSDNLFKSLVGKLNTRPLINTNKKVYVFRNLELSLDITKQDQTVISYENMVHYFGSNFAVTLYNQVYKTFDDFPKLNTYHDEYQVKTQIYKFTNCDLCLNTCSNKLGTSTYIEIIGVFSHEIGKNILDDIKTIFNLFD